MWVMDRVGSVALGRPANTPLLAGSGRACKLSPLKRGIFEAAPDRLTDVTQMLV
jgi:hypothetical protein